MLEMAFTGIDCAPYQPEDLVLEPDYPYRNLFALPGPRVPYLHTAVIASLRPLAHRCQTLIVYVGISTTHREVLCKDPIALKPAR